MKNLFKKKRTSLRFFDLNWPPVRARSYTRDHCPCRIRRGVTHSRAIFNETVCAGKDSLSIQSSVAIITERERTWPCI